MMAPKQSDAHLVITEDTLKNLEYISLIRLLGQWMGYLGRRYLRRLRPVADAERIRRRQRYFSSLLPIARDEGVLTLRDVPDIRPFLRRAQPEGAWLEPAELRAVSVFFQRIQAIRRWLAPHAAELGPLWERVRRVPRMKAFSREVHRLIRPDGELDETASPELRRITREWQGLRRHIEDVLRKLMHQPSIASALQDSIMTQRERRWVLLVRADQQGRVPGIVLGASSSGASIYVEPYGVVELNNRYVLLEDERKAEMIRILQRLTAPLRKIRDLNAFLRRVAFIDFVLGITAWAIRFPTALPQVSDGSEICLKGVRHPLLAARFQREGRSLIPVDLEMPAVIRAMILTGPNAGGKTVTLKTVGLTVLMAQVGLPIVAEAGSKLPVFSHLFADIGDLQDIYRDLSTFASHIERMVPMLTTEVRRALYLLDELGTGTDPVEGAALSQAILEALLEKPAKVIAVTHLAELKILALRDPRILSASMEFDADSLAPTYRLVPNSIGASHALDIARRMGVPAKVLEKARERMDPESRMFHEVIERLESRELQLQNRLREVDELQSARIRELERRLASLEEERERLRMERRGLERQIRMWWQKREEEWKQMIQRIDDMDRRRELRRMYRQWERAAERKRQTLMPETRHIRQIDIADLKTGQRVRLRGTSTSATVQAIDPRTSTVEVIYEGKRMTIPVGWIEQILEAGSHKVRTEIQASPIREEERQVNLLGYHSPEAKEILDRAIDRAIRAGWPSIRVIHGYRPGRLKREVLSYLKRHPSVERIEPAAPHAGGPGASVVYIKQSDDIDETIGP